MDEHIKALETEKQNFNLLESNQKRAAKKSIGEKVGHIMFRKSEAVNKHKYERISASHG